MFILQIRRLERQKNLAKNHKNYLTVAKKEQLKTSLEHLKLGLLDQNSNFLFHCLYFLLGRKSFNLQNIVFYVSSGQKSFKKDLGIGADSTIHLKQPQQKHSIKNKACLEPEQQNSREGTSLAHGHPGFNPGIPSGPRTCQE